jgi:predicted nucleotidyltransferase
MIKLEAGELDLVIRILKKALSDEKVIVFGSRVNGKAHLHSDLDLAIRGVEQLPLTALAELKDAFQESDLPFRVDVIDFHRVEASFQRVILTTGEELTWRE